MRQVMVICNSIVKIYKTELRYILSHVRNYYLVSRSISTISVEIALFFSEKKIEFTHI